MSIIQVSFYPVNICSFISISLSYFEEKILLFCILEGFICKIKSGSRVMDTEMDRCQYEDRGHGTEAIYSSSARSTSLAMRKCEI